MKRLLLLIPALLTLVAGFVAANASAATNPPPIQRTLACGQNSLQIPTDTVLDGSEGDVKPLAVFTVPANLVGKSVSVNAQAVNVLSVRKNSDIRISSGGSTPIELKDVERSENAITPGSGTLTLGNTVDVAVKLGVGGKFSGGGDLTLTVDCPPPPTPGCPADTTKISDNPLTCLKTVTTTVTVPGPSTTTTVFGNPTCPSGSTETSRGDGYVVCNTTTPGPERVVTVFGRPTCPSSATETGRGDGFVVCNTTTTVQGPERIRTVTKTIIKKVPGKTKTIIKKVPGKTKTIIKKVKVPCPKPEAKKPGRPSEKPDKPKFTP